MQLIVYFINSFKVNEKGIYFSPQYSLNLFTAHQEQKKFDFYLRATIWIDTEAAIRQAMCMVKKSMLVAPPMGGKIWIFYAFEFYKIFPLKCYIEFKFCRP